MQYIVDQKNDQLMNCLSYLNRLSDYLFVLARYIGKEQSLVEESWNKDVI